MIKKKMKGLFTLFFSFFTLISFSQVININTEEEFKAKIWNYEKNFQTFNYLGQKPCIIDFYADWCGPCRRLSPILEEIEKEYNGKILIYKINTDKQRSLASVFGIRSLPSLLFCPMKGQAQMAVGFRSKEQLKEMIDVILLKK